MINPIGGKSRSKSARVLQRDRDLSESTGYVAELMHFTPER